MAEKYPITVFNTEYAIGIINSASLLVTHPKITLSHTQRSDLTSRLDNLRRNIYGGKYDLEFIDAIASIIRANDIDGLIQLLSP